MRRSLGAALDLTGARLPSAFLIGLQFEDFSLAPSNCVVRTHVLSISFLLTAVFNCVAADAEDRDVAAITGSTTCPLPGFCVRFSIGVYFRKLSYCALLFLPGKGRLQNQPGRLN